VRRAVAVALLLVGCGDDGDGGDAGPTAYEVVLVAAADPGDERTETWHLSCGDDACLLDREAGGPLGGVTELRLSRTDDGSYRGAARSGCATVDVELDRDDDVVVGSIALGGCEDATLGFSGAPPP
jgi:hypothetical protein